jgi:hypothetical protein
MTQAVLIRRRRTETAPQFSRRARNVSNSVPATSATSAIHAIQWPLVAMSKEIAIMKTTTSREARGGMILISGCDRRNMVRWR